MRFALFVAGVTTLLTVVAAVSALTWSPTFGPEPTIQSRITGPAIALLLLVIGWAWLLRIVRSR